MLCLHFALSPLDNYEKYSFPSALLVLFFNLKLSFLPHSPGSIFYFISTVGKKKKSIKSSVSGTKTKQRQKLPNLKLSQQQNKDQVKHLFFPTIFIPLKKFKRKKATKTQKFNSFLPELMEISLEEMCLIS